MTLIFDILHLAVAALLAIIGVGYEREAECPPVRFQPAAEVETATADSEQAQYVEIADCEGARTALQFPAL